MTKLTAAITAVGKYVPEDVLTNDMLSKMVETNDEWITTRTGIKERRILKEDGKGTSYMAIKSKYNFVGGFENDSQGGLLHVANHHISPGKKQWTWGHSDFGKAWRRSEK